MQDQDADQDRLLLAKDIPTFSFSFWANFTKLLEEAETKWYLHVQNFVMDMLRICIDAPERCACLIQT